MTNEQLEYLKTWVTRTRSDVDAIKTGTPQLIDDVSANLDELEKYLDSQAAQLNGGGEDGE